MVRICVITATYNCAATIKGTLDSFLSQDYPLKELILVDGGSTDGTLELARESGVPKVIISEKDRGIYDALNKGIQLAEGEVIGFLHSGDSYRNCGILSLVARQFDKAQIMGVYGDLRYVNGENRKVIRYWRSGSFERKKLFRGWMPPHPTLYLRKEVYRENGNFDLDFRIAADYDLMLRVLKNPGFKLAYIPKILIDMETGGLSNGRLKDIVQKTREDYRALLKNGIGPAWLVLFRKNFRKLDQFFKSEPE